MKRYDAYGRPEQATDYRSNREVLPYQIEETGEVTYLRFWDSNETVIRRITITGAITTIEHAYGDWSNRANLNYRCINHILEV